MSRGPRRRQWTTEHRASGQFWPPTEADIDPEEAMIARHSFEPFELDLSEPPQPPVDEGVRREPEGEDQPEPPIVVQVASVEANAVQEPTPMDVEETVDTTAAGDAEATNGKEPERGAVGAPEQEQEVAPAGSETNDERPPPENFPMAWYQPQGAEAAPQVERIPIPTEPLRRPHLENFSGVEEGEIVEEESGRSEMSREEWALTGAVPRRLNGATARERMDEEPAPIQQVPRRRGSPEGQLVEINFQEIPRTGDSRFLPVESAPQRAASENWDDTVPQPFLPPPPPSAVAAETRSRHRSKGRASRYNPRRHLEMDDYVSSVPEREQSPPPTHSRPRQLSTGESREPRSRERRDGPSRTPGNNGFPIRLAGVKFGGLKPIETNPQVDPPPFCCFNCWQRGHTALRCPREQIRVYCYNCGRSGVDLAVCPRCSEPHRRYVEQQYGRQERSRSRPANEERRDERERTEQSPAEERVPARQDLDRRPSTCEHRPRGVRGTEKRERDAILEAITILQGLQDLPVDTRDGMIRRLYLERNNR